LEIDLMATPTFSPEDVRLSGRVINDTLIGVVTAFTTPPDSGSGLPTYRTVEVHHFKAARRPCLRRGAA